ncbi:MAG: VanR-ABDEGLN family response regulator transcription factor [Oscillospiraceae bacterium]|jgi:two-component system response regulator VanR|nr:VanR-ABDEGLN family response regulator transcription factor [Oscillospiraceae bacterium]
MNETIMVVDDEREIADLVEFYLTNEGYLVHKFYNGNDALACAERCRLDLAILDVMLPDVDGCEVCRRVRERHTYPILMLTAKAEEIDKITGLALGADDYITKPFRPLELVARVKAQLRRYTRYNEPPDTRGDGRERVLSVRGLTLNLDSHECALDERPVQLTPIEFGILRLLCDTPGKVIPAEEIFERVWGEKALNNANNTVMVHIRHLRGKLRDSTERPKYIRTVWGVGYKLEK